jgi:hypothetical protein
MGLRTAFSTANKALSWRGDHPMKNEHFFKANELSQEEKGQGRTYTTRLAQKQGARNAAGTSHLHYFENIEKLHVAFWGAECRHTSQMLKHVIRRLLA